MKDLLESWKISLSQKIEEIFGLKVEPELIVIDFPPKLELGDATTSVSFLISKKIGKTPLEIASLLKDIKLESVIKVESVGPYLNLFIDRTKILNFLYPFCKIEKGDGEKIIVEHTNINPNKAAHIGHLRNAILGDTLQRCLKFLGKNVEVQNYIDDTGVQVADVVVGFEKLLNANLERVKEIAKENEKFDYFLWELYSNVQKWYEEDEENLKCKFTTLHLIEEGNNETAEIASFVSQSMVACHLKTMSRLNIKYDLLPFESDILKSGFLNECFENLKEKGSLEYVPPESEDKLRGCWVMRLSENKEFEGLKDADKVFLRSNGTATYLAKDLSYQMWKLGLLKKDFTYKKFPFSPYAIYRTSHNKNDEKLNFGKGSKVINVIDVRQSYLQKIVKEGLKILGYTKEAESSIHFSYEMVALSTSFIKEEIGKGKKINVSSDDLKKPFIEMSGRKGLGFIADSLIDALIERAKSEIENRNEDIEEEEKEEIARKIAIAALKFYILKFTRNQVVAFDLKNALSFEGESGPYIQYAAVRASNILLKSSEKGLKVPEINEENIKELFPKLDDDSWQILSLLMRFDVVVNKSVETLEMSTLLRYIFEISKAFHNYYQKVPVLSEKDSKLREAKLLFVSIFYYVFKKILEEILGIEVPKRM